VVINPPRTAPRRILIIEDNPDTALSLSDALAPLGHEVRVEVDPLKGIEAARDFRPDVLLCDIGLPSIDGYEVARRFRADEQLKSTFLIAVTGYAQPADQEKAARAGFDRHFAKPADLERLRELLSEPTPGRPASA
jgi:CheY-like chemotaxis protein